MAALDAGVEASPDLSDGACPKFGTPACTLSTSGIETLSQATVSQCVYASFEAGGGDYEYLEQNVCGGLTALAGFSGADSFGVLLFDPATGDLVEVGGNAGSPDVRCYCSVSGLAAPCPDLFFGMPAGTVVCPLSDAGPIQPANEAGGEAGGDAASE